MDFTEFHRDGVMVFEGVLTPEEVATARDCLHRDLGDRGIRHLDFNSGTDGACRASEIDRGLRPETQSHKVSGARLKSAASSLFYPRWKVLDIQLHPKVVACMQGLMAETYLSQPSAYPNPFHVLSNRLYPFIDRVCYRLPDCIEAQGGLGLHIDNRPRLDLGSLKKWRPIQGFVALTDHFSAEHGGLKVVRSFHSQFDQFFKDYDGPVEAGEFFRMNSVKYAKLQKQCQFVYAPAGSLVCWDNRTPHATCDVLSGNDSREVVYTSFLPDCDLNRQYAQEQWTAMTRGQPPPAFPTSLPTDAGMLGLDWCVEPHRHLFVPAV
jgi:hypothetical protein